MTHYEEAPCRWEPEPLSNTIRRLSNTTAVLKTVSRSIYEFSTDGRTGRQTDRQKD